MQTIILTDTSKRFSEKRMIYFRFTNYLKLNMKHKKIMII
jgi:hypothetical protein